jgi:hypothetical protein
MSEYKNEFLQNIINHYQPMSEVPLTVEDGRLIADSLLALGKWVLSAKQRIKARIRRIPFRKFFNMQIPCFDYAGFRPNVFFVAGTDKTQIEDIKPEYYDTLDYTKNLEVIQWVA